MRHAYETILENLTKTTIFQIYWFNQTQDCIWGNSVRKHRQIPSIRTLKLRKAVHFYLTVFLLISRGKEKKNQNQMATRLSKAEKKIAYDARLCKLLEEYSQILIVAADNVGSNQLQHIRAGLRDHSIVLMGKNTMMKRSIRLHAERTGNRDLLNLIPLLQVMWLFIWSVYSIIVLFYFLIFVTFFFHFFIFWLNQGNVGMIFTKGDLKEVSDEVSKHKVAAPARVGLVAPIDVVVPPGNTGLDPSQTSFFQVNLFIAWHQDYFLIWFF